MYRLIQVVVEDILAQLRIAPPPGSVGKTPPGPSTAAAATQRLFAPRSLVCADAAGMLQPSDPMGGSMNRASASAGARGRGASRGGRQGLSSHLGLFFPLLYPSLFVIDLYASGSHACSPACRCLAVGNAPRRPIENGRSFAAALLAGWLQPHACFARPLTGRTLLTGTPLTPYMLVTF
jgi:hypothetical protein